MVLFDDDPTWYRSDGMEEARKKWNKLSEVVSKNIGKPVELESGLEALLEHNPGMLRKVKVRYFFSKGDKNEIYSRDFTESASTNLIHMRISPVRNPKNTKWNYEGTKEIGDNFEAGYTLNVTFTKDDQKLRRNLIKKFMRFNFGCFPSRKTILGHRNDDSPTISNAKEILAQILAELK